LLPEIGIEVNREDLDKFSKAGIERILTFQTPSGGLSYWPGDTNPHAFGTAFGLTALIEAKKRGYNVPDNAFDKMGDYLENILGEKSPKKGMDSYSDADADTLAFFVMTLGRMGRPQSGYISRLWENKDELSGFGLAFLAVAVRESGENNELYKQILDSLKNNLVINESEASIKEEEQGGWGFNSSSRSLASIFLAYSLSDENKDLTRKLLKGLMSRRSDKGFWGNTQENVFAVMAIYQYAIQGEKDIPNDFDLSINGSVISKNKMKIKSKKILSYTLNENELSGNGGVIKCSLKNNSSIPLYMTARLSYEAPLNDKAMKEFSSGYSISRSYETVKGSNIDRNSIPLGGLVLVKLKVKINKTGNYISIEDKIPAGLEPLNTNLATTENVDLKLSDTAKKTLKLISYSEIRDSRVTFFADILTSGEYEFTYMARATTPGKFIRPSARVEAMYQNNIFGNSSAETVTVK
jgi:alpha-2-macroglobulin